MNSRRDIATDGQSITVTHVTIRQSISVLLLRLIVLELLISLGVIAFHTVILSTGIREVLGENITFFNIPIFITLVFLKILAMVFITFQWINEYYEINPHEIIHKRGLIFKKTERYKLKHLGSLRMEQGVLGRILNYGTIKLYNWTTEKGILLYLIHNPMKYHHILETILPEIDEEKQVIREHIFEEEVV